MFDKLFNRLEKKKRTIKEQQRKQDEFQKKVSDIEKEKYHNLRNGISKKTSKQYFYDSETYGKVFEK